MTVASDRITKDFNNFGATQAAILDISKDSESVWYADFLHKVKFHGIPSKLTVLNLPFLGNGQLQLVLSVHSSQEYLINAHVPQGSILYSTFFWLNNSDLSDDVICNIGIYADDYILL